MVLNSWSWFVRDWHGGAAPELEKGCDGPVEPIYGKRNSEIRGYAFYT
jgi:hypothetical protein